MNSEPMHQIVNGFAGACKGLRLYPPRHPSIQSQIERLLHSLQLHLGSRSWFKIGLLEETLFIDDQLFALQTPAIEVLTGLLQRLQIELLEFHRGLETRELIAFLQILDDPVVSPEDLKEIFERHRIRHIRLAENAPDEDREPRKIYGRAMTVVNEIFQDVRLGHIPSSEKARHVVKDMARLTLSDPHALFALSMLKSYDNYTFTHSVNVSVIALAVGRACGLDETELLCIGLGGLLHDIGKLKIDLNIINKPGRLSEQEFSQIMHHPRLGANMVRESEGVSSTVVDIVLGHHLRYDLQGYPADARLQGPLKPVHITAIADCYDAITTLRAYQRPITPRQAIAKMLETSGSVLNPDYLNAFVDSLGSYPVGSLVRLASNEVGLVTRVGRDNPEEIELKIVFNARGERLETPELRKVESNNTHLLVAEVDAFIKGVNPLDFF